MKRFKEFKIDPILITAHPVHGSHSVPKSKRGKKDPVIISAQPVHGKHSIKESEDLEKALKEIDEKQPKKVDSREWAAENPNSHLGRTVDHVHDVLAKDHDIHDAHKRAIQYYTEGSKALNGRLIQHATGKRPYWHMPPSGVHTTSWSKRTTPKDLVKPSHSYYSRTPLQDKLWHRKQINKSNFYAAAYVNTLDKAIAHTPLEHDIHVFHGASFNPGEEASKHPDRLIKSPAYLSTSLSRSTAHGFAAPVEGRSHIIHIHLKKGQKARYIAHHSSLGREEYEMLLPRSTTLKIHKSPTVLTNGTHVWHAEVHD